MTFFQFNLVRFLQIIYLPAIFFVAWPDLVEADINGKGLLCTCSEERAVRVSPDPICKSEDVNALDLLFRCMGYEEKLKCSHPMSEGAKHSLTGDPADVDSFFFFDDNEVVEEVLVRHNDVHKYVYNDDKHDFSSDIHSIKWGDRYSYYVLDRRYLTLVRMEDWSIEVATYQCQVFETLKEFNELKARYEERYRREYERKKNANRNQL